MKAAYGAGCEEPGLIEAINKGVIWLKGRGAASDDGDGFPYVVEGGGAEGSGSHTMRAVGVLCLQLYREGKTPEIKDEIKKIAKKDIDNLDWDDAPHGS